MTLARSSFALPPGEYRVPAPLVTDAAAVTLRGAYRAAGAIPTDWIAMLATLDRMGHA